MNRQPRVELARRHRDRPRGRSRRGGSCAAAAGTRARRQGAAADRARRGARRGRRRRDRVARRPAAPRRRAGARADHDHDDRPQGRRPSTTAPPTTTAGSSTSAPDVASTADRRPRTTQPVTSTTGEPVTGTERLRARFVAEHAFPLDDFQRRALDALDAGRSVLVAAPTGAGKTLVAEYAIAAALESGDEDLLHDAAEGAVEPEVRRLRPPPRRGRTSGCSPATTSINGDAPIVVMTTEVLRNMIYAGSPALDRPALRRARRGALPPGPRPRRGVGGGDHPPARPRSRSWRSRRPSRTPRRSRRGCRPCAARPRRSSRSAGRSSSCTSTWSASAAPSALHLLPTFVEDGGELRPNPVAARLDGRGPTRGARARRPRLYKPWRTEVVERLADERMLPGDRVRVLPRRLRPGGRAVPRRRDPAHRLRRARRAAAHRRRAPRGARRRRPRRARLRRVARRASRRASPRTTRAWCRR